MSQKLVYVRRALTPRYDPDPDPDPIGVVAIAILAIIGVAGGTVLTNPNILNNILMMLDPELKEVEEKRIEANKQLMTTVGIVMVLVAVIVLAYIWWRWNMQKKEARKRRNYTRRTLRTLRR